MKRLDDLSMINNSPLTNMKEDGNELYWLKNMKKLFKSLYQMEKQKYLEPKFSPSLQPLMKYLIKKHGGSTNQSMIQGSEKGGSQINGMHGIDNISLSSFMSTDTKKMDPISKLNFHSIQNDRNNTQFSMQEKPEEEDDKVEIIQQDLITHLGRNNGLKQGEQTYQNRNIKDNGNPMFEPLFGDKYSNRTISVNSQGRNNPNQQQLYYQQNSLNTRSKDAESFNEFYQDPQNFSKQKVPLTPIKDHSTMRKRRVSRQQKQLLDMAYKTAYNPKMTNDFVVKKKKLVNPTLRQNNSKISEYSNSIELGNKSNNEIDMQNSNVDYTANDYFKSQRSKSFMNSYSEQKPKRNNQNEMFQYSLGANYSQQQTNFVNNKQKLSSQRSTNNSNQPAQNINIIYNVQRLNMKFLPQSQIQRKYVKNLNELVKIHSQIQDRTS